ncbi:MAG: ATP-binding protein [Candidatus Sumerlaeota bacterium]|nr:ATP-binding protein [Candidatus Sumerlaeota bacterium]
MVPRPANFSVDPRLASLLGETYRSSEKALREIVDNAWDADAENVWIEMPDLWEEHPIIIRDDGTGMTEKEVRSEYLAIANARATRKGKETAVKRRRVKGRRGIGKFAGLVLAATMEILTKARGKQTKLMIRKSDILQAGRDLERIGLPVEVVPCDAEEHGTTVTLSDLDSRLNPPSPDKVKEMLVLEYGREPDFTIQVNGSRLASHDVSGEKFIEETDLEGVGKVRLAFTITDEPKGATKAGVVTRVGGKLVGTPGFFGIEEREDIPAGLRNRIIGEIEADGLEDDVSADWGGLLENSKAYKSVQEWANGHLTQAVETTFARDVNLARARLQKQINRRLQDLPEYRRKFASDALDRVLKRFYGESQERVATLVSLVLEALERDEYWIVCKNIEDAQFSDIVQFAEALASFGLLEMALMARQAQSRLKFLEHLQALANNPDTLEREMHLALEKNLWVFGAKYSLMTSNQSTTTIIAKFLGRRFPGKGTAKRPDLLLAQNVEGRYLLIEFKRPSDPVGREVEAQANQYRDELGPNLGYIEIIIIGGSVEHMDSHYQQPDTWFFGYEGVICTARTQLEWLLKELTATNGANPQFDGLPEHLGKSSKQ